MKTQVLTVMMTGALLSTVAYADSIGRSSNPAYIQVGGTEQIVGDGSDVHTGEPGSPGIGVHTSKTPFKRVSLGRLRAMSIVGLGGGYNWSKQVAYIDENNWLMPPSHRDFGHYAFGRVSNGNNNHVYFGEWSDEDNINDGTHTVYYVGEDKTTSMPSSDTATYTVRGINNARNTNVLNQRNATTGNFKADFSQNTLTGSMTNGNLTIAIKNNTINPATASFSGTATALPGGGVIPTTNCSSCINGSSKGEFFGNNAAALGGIATFTGNSQYDTAFAGTKDTK